MSILKTKRKFVVWYNQFSNFDLNASFHISQNRTFYQSAVNGYRCVLVKFVVIEGTQQKHIFFVFENKR